MIGRNIILELLSRRHRSRDYYIITYGTRHQMRDGIDQSYFIITFDESSPTWRVAGPLGIILVM